MRTAAHAATITTAFAVWVLAGLFYVDMRDERDDADRAACLQAAALTYAVPQARAEEIPGWGSAEDRQVRRDEIDRATSDAREEAAEDCM